MIRTHWTQGGCGHQVDGVLGDAALERRKFGVVTCHTGSRCGTPTTGRVGHAGHTAGVCQADAAMIRFQELRGEVLIGAKCMGVFLGGG